MALIIRSMRWGAVISRAYSPRDSGAISASGSWPRAMATRDVIMVSKSSASRCLGVKG